VFTDNQNRIVMTNPAFTKLTGYTAGEAKNRDAEFLFSHPEALLGNEGGLIQSVCEMECSLKDGSVIPTETRGTHVQDSDGEFIGYLIVLRDITWRKVAEKEQVKLETKLIQSCKMEAIGTLAGGIAHDFNNILGIIFVNTDLALEDIPEGNPARTNVQRIVQASIRARNLVEQILVYSRQEDQKLIPLMPGSLVKESLQFLRSTTPASVKILQHINDEFRAVLMDPAQLQQLLLNLFSNAVRAVRGIGIVEVTGTVVELDEFDVNGQQNIPPGHYFRLNIMDTGVGMDRETQERIFDPFYTTLKVGEGTGMGLATAMGIVRSHGGHIRVDSEPGSGTTIEVFFPIVAMEEDQGESIESLQGTERVLFVDDETMLVEMASIFLRRQGFRVTEKTDSLQALETFRSKPDEFDIVITDQTMPEMTGSELAVEMFKIRPDVPVILLSGYSKKISDEEVKELGIKEFLHKPFDGKTLVRSIRKVLDE
jgi:PAS domain S-box-containing protein